MKTIERVATIAATSIGANLVRIAAFAFTALSVAIASLSIATAAGLQPLSFGGYYQDSSPKASRDGQTVGNCGANFDTIDTCYLIFKIVPPGKRLIITKVSCDNFTNQGFFFPLRLLTLHFNTPVALHYLPSVQSAASQRFTVSETTLQLVDSGERAVIVMQTSQSTIIEPGCTIAGQFIDVQ